MMRRSSRSPGLWSFSRKKDKWRYVFESFAAHLPLDTKLDTVVIAVKEE